MGLGAGDFDWLFGFGYFGLLVGVGLGMLVEGLSILAISGAIQFCEWVFTISSFPISSSKFAPLLFITFFIRSFLIFMFIFRSIVLRYLLKLHFCKLSLPGFIRGFTVRFRNLCSPKVASKIS